MILLGFATLMFGMEAMSGAVSGLRDLQVPESVCNVYKSCAWSIGRSDSDSNYSVQLCLC